MPTCKADPTELTLNQLSIVTGCTYRTLKERLESLKQQLPISR